MQFIQYVNYVLIAYILIAEKCDQYISTYDGMFRFSWYIESQ